MRIAVDATPAAVQHGGVGRYARELLRALVSQTLDHQFTLSAAATDDQLSELLAYLPPGAWREVRRLPASERIMTLLWQRARLPLSIERWIGRNDVFHGTDFVLPPTRARTVVTIHDLSFLIHPEFSQPELAEYLKAAVPRSIRKADAVVTVSAAVAAEVATAFPNARSKIIAIPNGVLPPSTFERLESSRAPTVLMVGTIEPRKNHRTILRAMAEVRDTFQDARLVIVGRRGWLDDEIVKEFEAGQDAGWIAWLDDASDEELAAAYERATLFVAGSLYEGFGLPVLEAMARGIPCLVSDIPAHREVAGGSVRYASPNDAGAYAATIVELLGDAAGREQLGMSGNQRAKQFSWQATAQRTLRAYDFAAGGGA